MRQLQPVQQQPLALEPAQAAVTHYYRFRERLQQGVILRRRARFTLEVAVGGETLLCYCPTTFMFLSGSRLNGEQARCCTAVASPATSACIAYAHAPNCHFCGVHTLHSTTAVPPATQGALRDMRAYSPRHACMLSGLGDCVQVPCLLSRVDASVPRSVKQQRQTAHTVEAISLDACASWIGINQCHIGRHARPPLLEALPPQEAASQETWVSCSLPALFSNPTFISVPPPIPSH